MVEVHFENIKFGPCSIDAALNYLALDGWVAVDVPDYPTVFFKKRNPDPLDRNKYLYAKIVEVEGVLMPLEALSSVVSQLHHHP